MNKYSVWNGIAKDLDGSKQRDLKRIDLTEKIEYHLNKWLNGTAEERLDSGKEARKYALEYKEATREEYRPGWKKN